MTDTAELVRVLREQAKKNSAKIFLPVDVYPEWQAAAALEATQARADKLEAELATLREVANHNYEVSQKHLARAESAESSLAAAKERLATLRNEVLEEAAKIADEERDCAATDAYDDRQALGVQYDPNCYGTGYDAGRKAAAEQIAAAIRSQGEP